MLAVKRGEVSKIAVSHEITRLEAAARRRLDRGTSPLPATADVDRITDWAISAQRRHWGWT